MNIEELLTHNKLWLAEEVKDSHKEIERLNNIINEYEKWLNYEMDENYTDRTIDEYNVYAYCYTKLKELKGSDK